MDVCKKVFTLDIGIILINSPCRSICQCNDVFRLVYVCMIEGENKKIF